ncbi:MAG TPA: UPF0175 family protein [Thermodesulfovibrionia bacterium]|nr:UPF0175 family protein [Thermodesulfovibrionia bacterium]
MKAISIQIPEEILLSSKIPRKTWESSIKKELALQLYREGLISFAHAHKLAEMSKIDFHFLLGERKIPRQYDIEDYEKDLENLAKWRAGE